MPVHLPYPNPPLMSIHTGTPFCFSIVYTAFTCGCMSHWLPERCTRHIIKTWNTEREHRGGTPSTLNSLRNHDVLPAAAPRREKRLNVAEGCRCLFCSPLTLVWDQRRRQRCRCWWCRDGGGGGRWAAPLLRHGSLALGAAHSAQKAGPLPSNSVVAVVPKQSAVKCANPGPRAESRV